jgi:hypothetical protein
LIFGCALAAFVRSVGGANPDAVTDTMTDDELRIFRDAKVAELRQRMNKIEPKKAATGTTYSRVFFCTLYYTPKESGFTAEHGFDTKLVSAPGLGGRKYPRDFLLAVKKEGFGRLVQPVGGRNYVRWLGNGRYGFAQAPVGRHGELLVPKRSCAISRRNRFLRQHDTIIVKSETVNHEIGRDEWFVCDTGPGVHPLQIDLYWGDDEPRGAVGRQRARPTGTWMEYAFETEVTAER